MSLKCFRLLFLSVCTHQPHLLKPQVLHLMGQERNSRMCNDLHALARAEIILSFRPAARLVECDAHMVQGNIPDAARQSIDNGAVFTFTVNIGETDIFN